jgi:NlpC/P60 family
VNCLLPFELLGARVTSGRDCVRKVFVDVGITRRAFNHPLNYLRGVVIAALALALLAIGTTGFIRPVSARAATAVAAVHHRRAYHRGLSVAQKLTRLRIIAWQWAEKQRGKPYIWGGTGPQGFDCSGLVYAAYRQAGFILPRTTYEMLASWQLVRIPRSKARRGDLAFFGSGHVELFGWGDWTFGAEAPGTLLGFHQWNAFWYPTMFFRVRYRP